MLSNLRVKVYDVEFGDCVLVQFPDRDRIYSILVDCGTWSAFDPIVKDVLAEIENDLPIDGDKRRLDLLVATHPHLDHIKGFDYNYLKNVKIYNIWLSCFLDLDHKQSKANALAIQELAESAARSIDLRCVDKNSQLEMYLQNRISKSGAIVMLRDTLPQKNGIKPLYMCRDLADSTLNLIDDEKKQKYKLSFSNKTTCFKDFKEPDTSIRILSPEYNIDKYYLGDIDARIGNLSALYTLDKDNEVKINNEEVMYRLPEPDNISKRDFRILCDSLHYSALSFMQLDDHLTNDTSIVFLLEWRRKRLLFTGDAEFHRGEIEEEASNASWDVIVEKLKNEDYFRDLDFLKVSHHGSINGTPFIDEEGVTQTVLNRIIPKDRGAKIVVSTKPKVKGRNVPNSNLMIELGGRCSDYRIYPYDPEYPELEGKKQPRRTDKEGTIEIIIEPGAD